MRRSVRSPQEHADAGRYVPDADRRSGCPTSTLSGQRSTADTTRHRRCSRGTASSRCSACSGRLTAASCTPGRTPRAPAATRILVPAALPTPSAGVRAAVDKADCTPGCDQRARPSAPAPERSRSADEDECVDERPRELDPARESHDEEHYVGIPLTLALFLHRRRMGKRSVYDRHRHDRPRARRIQHRDVGSVWRSLDGERCRTVGVQLRRW